MKEQRTNKLSRKKLFLAVAFAVIFLIAVGAWRQYVNAIPEVETPTPKMPLPNAYDFYVKAGEAIVPANPAVDPIHDLKNVPKSQWKIRYPTAKKVAWLRQNTQVLSLLREGFKYPCVAPPQRTLDNPARRSLVKFRQIARMLIVESHVRGERGDWRGAAGSTLDAFRLGHDVPRGGPGINFLVGCAINAIARRELWEILPHLSAEESKSVAQELESLHLSRVPFADVLREEKFDHQAIMVEVMKSNVWRNLTFSRNSGAGSLKGRWQTWSTPRRVIFQNFTNYMDALIVNAQKPYAARVAEPAVPDDFLNQVLAPAVSRYRWNYARDESGNTLLLTALALRAYKLEHNRYPKTLKELVPGYLQKIPADPFGGGEQLRYKLSGAEYSLYSIGPDGFDNNGRAIENTKISKEKRGRFVVQPESKGDMVAGIN